jgi:hypothetical protein
MREARKSIAAAVKSADISEQALVKLERAFLFPKLMAINPILDANGNKAFAFRMYWQNSGRSAVREVKFTFRFDHFLGELPDDFAFPTAEPTPDIRPIYLAPNHGTWSAVIAAPIAVIDAVRMGHIRLYFWGWVTYRDIFEGTPAHITKFCWETILSGDDPYLEGSQLFCHFRTSERKNCFDEDCAQQDETGQPMS